MTQIFDEGGNAVPVTMLEAGPCFVTQVKTVEKEQYAAVQLAFQSVREKLLSKAEAGHLKKAGVPLSRHLGEFRDYGSELAQGQEVRADIFEVGEKVKVTAVSKGKGFQGAIKRHGHSRGRETHGSHFHRAPGSLGSTSTPGRVFKGKKMPGQTGGQTVSTINLRVIRVDPVNNLLLIEGSVPGPRTGIVRVEAMK